MQRERRFPRRHAAPTVAHEPPPRHRERAGSAIFSPCSPAPAAAMPPTLRAGAVGLTLSCQRALFATRGAGAPCAKHSTSAWSPTCASGAYWAQFEGPVDTVSTPSTTAFSKLRHHRRQELRRLRRLVGGVFVKTEATLQCAGFARFRLPARVRRRKRFAQLNLGGGRTLLRLSILIPDLSS